MLALFFTAFATTIKHSRFTHVLIMMFIIAFITNDHQSCISFFMCFFVSKYLIKSVRESCPRELTIPTIVSSYIVLFSFFFSDSLNAFTSSADLVLQEPNFNFSSIFLNILSVDSQWHILAYCPNVVPNFLEIFSNWRVSSIQKDIFQMIKCFRC